MLSMRATLQFLKKHLKSFLFRLRSKCQDQVPNTHTIRKQDCLGKLALWIELEFVFRSVLGDVKAYALHCRDIHINERFLASPRQFLSITKYHSMQRTISPSSRMRLSLTLVVLH